MRSGTHTGLALAVVIAANWMAAAPNWVAVERQRAVQPKHRERIERERPERVLLGDSILRGGVDPELLSRRLGERCLVVARGGSASAWWYLALKNLIAAAAHPVPEVAIVFRDHLLTEPGHRVSGRYRRAIDRIAGPSEPVLDRLAYLQGMDAFTYLLYRFVPLYQRRESLREAVDSALKDGLVGRALGLAPGGADAAIGRVFAAERLEPGAWGLRQAEAEAPGSEAAWDFAARLPGSFLPEMLRVADERGIRLLFVRAKRRRDLAPGAEPPALRAYVADLEAWLAERGSPLVDFSRDPRLRPEHYADGDHLAPAGRAVFTEMLAEALLDLRSGGRRGRPRRGARPRAGASGSRARGATPGCATRPRRARGRRAPRCRPRSG